MAVRLEMDDIEREPSMPVERLHWRGSINLETGTSTHLLVDYSIEILGEIEWSGDMPKDARGTNESWRLIMGKAYGKDREQALRRVHEFQNFKRTVYWRGDPPIA
jgi:hypothetical protein